MQKRTDQSKGDLIVTKDEMNLVEIPFGPITTADNELLTVSTEVYDRVLGRRVQRKTVITGSRLFGLPRPIDDQVLVGLQALTYESGYTSRKVKFSRYRLCHLLGWPPDGRSYKRLEESFDRIAGTTLKFKDSWYDKGEREWKSKTFHLIDEVDLCSQDRLARARKTGTSDHMPVSSFLWNETLWKSFQDGFIKSLDMKMFRRIARGRRREVPLRLFRILDKRFHSKSKVSFDLRSLSVDKLGLSGNYGPSQMLRIIQRAGDWLIECDYLRTFQISPQSTLTFAGGKARRSRKVVFYRQTASSRKTSRKRLAMPSFETKRDSDTLRVWLSNQQPEKLERLEKQALESGFGSTLERNLVHAEVSQGRDLLTGGRIRQEFVRRFASTPEHTGS